MKYITLMTILLASVSVFASPIKSNVGALHNSILMESENDIIEIEYLLSTGEQYLLFIEPIDGIDCWILPQNNRTYTDGQSVGRYNGGSRADAIAFTTIENRGLGVYNRANGQPVFTYNMSRNHLFHVVVHEKDVEVDGVSYTMGASWTRHDNNIPFALFGSYRMDMNVVNPQSCQIGRCALYVGDDLVYDLVPIRIGNVGYMLDTISGELLSNQGTGEFLLGPDVKYK